MRYFIEVMYMGTAYSGFQEQKNANTIQAEVGKALTVFYKKGFNLTGSSRTDAGVHALQNYFHFDAPVGFEYQADDIYNLNSILPAQIVILSIKRVGENAHCRFDAVQREYVYRIYQKKNPFLADRAYYYPYKLDIDLLKQAAEMIKEYEDFTSFSKRNTQVKNFICTIRESKWALHPDTVEYTVSANRFLRGMVRGLAGTMLKVGTGKNSIEELKAIIESKDCSKADFSTPAHGLFLKQVIYKEQVFI